MENLNNLKYGKFRLLMDTMEAYGKISDQTKEIITKEVQSIKIKKGELLNDSFDLTNTVFFIQKGFIRCLIKTNEKEVTTWISGKGSFILGIREIFGDKPIKEKLEAISKSELYYIGLEDFFNILKRDFKLFEIYQKLLQDYYAKAEERVYLSKIPNAPERLQHFLNSEKAKELKELPDKYIAELLNIRPETFSRLKIIDENQDFTK